ncbi:nucleolar protein [Anaeramoeba ignava]|uniref:Nucleolar protein 58 n=1 Tax=Anaeramoeba ignava TaxID=1746090 RepID=A0A9Q0RAK6_ANAIG|nr:nucleolar protein [Anaeramoeba ignava]
MFVLFETSTGYALFKILDEGKITNPDFDLIQQLSDPNSAQRVIQLQAFSRFEDTTNALQAVESIVKSKLDNGLQKFLQKEILEKNQKITLGVGDLKLAGILKRKLGLNTIYNSSMLELMRGIRTNMISLLPNIEENEFDQMSRGLSHNFSRHKLKFSAEKVDTMIVHAVSLLDDLEKELNTYSMRAKEWYGWHFPELAKIVPDNFTYAKVITVMGMSHNAPQVDFGEILPEKVANEVKEAAQITMGTQINEEDLSNILQLCEQIVALTEYKNQLLEYLKNRMRAIAPNLTALVGELVGARLISHAGSLRSLSKYPASTIQVLGAEKALFRALRKKHDTPKYGILYQASFVGQASPKNKGKISRALAAKCALSIRVDALSNSDSNEIGNRDRLKIEEKIIELENRKMHRTSTKIETKRSNIKKYEKPEENPQNYNTQNDFAIDTKSNKNTNTNTNTNANQNDLVIDIRSNTNQAQKKMRKKKGKKNN